MNEMGERWGCSPVCTGARCRSVCVRVAFWGLGSFVLYGGIHTLISGCFLL